MYELCQQPLLTCCTDCYFSIHVFFIFLNSFYSFMENITSTMVSLDRILPPCNCCHHPWCVGDKSYHKALLIMFSFDGISDHASWNEVFHYRDTKLSCHNITSAYFNTEYQCCNKVSSNRNNIIVTKLILDNVNQLNLTDVKFSFLKT